MPFLNTWKRRLKHRLLKAKVGISQHRWELALAENPRLQTIAAGDEQFTYRHFKTYLNRSLNAKEKLAILHYTAERLCDVLDDRSFAAAFGHQGLLLARLPLKDDEGEARILLRRSTFPREGEVGLMMEADNIGPIYQLSFSLAPSKTLLIGGLQGPRLEQGDVIKRYTKALHGLRPQNAMMSAMYACAQAFDMKGVKGIANQAHPRRKRLKSSYDDFWQEYGATLASQGWFDLPVHEPERDIMNVKSQRRAAFRRREALRGEMVEQIAMVLQQPSAD